VTDISTSATTNGLTNRLHQEGGKLPAPWVIDGHGKPSDDPAVLFKEPKGTILPLGGLDSGHKGYGLSLLVEALDRRPGGLRPRRSQAGLGRDGVPAGDRPGGVRRQRRFRAADGRSRRASAMRRGPRSRASPVRLPGEKGFALARSSAEGRDAASGDHGGAGALGGEVEGGGPLKKPRHPRTGNPGFAALTATRGHHR
jgi:hypothetical protein